MRIIREFAEILDANEAYENSVRLLDLNGSFFVKFHLSFIMILLMKM